MFKKITASISALMMAMAALVFMPQSATAAINDVCGVAAGTPAVTFLSSATFGIDAAFTNNPDQFPRR